MPPSDRKCVVCGTPLRGPQRKYCSSEECKKMGAREAWLMATYGITLTDFDVIMKHQDGKCPICKRSFGPSVKPVVDHEHGAHVRGIACDYCNRRMIGRLKSWERAAALAEYLKEPPAVAALGRHVIAPGRKPQKRTRRTYRRRKAA